MFLQEHWLRALLGDEPWRHPAQYFPARGSLGYYDAHFLQALVYIPLRLLGIERYLALQLQQLILTAIGFAGFWLLSRGLLRTPVPIALIGSLLFTFASSLHASTSQPQLFSIYFVPWLCLALTHGWRISTESVKRAACWWLAAGFGYALLFFTSFYIAWFVAITVAVVGFLLVLSRPAGALAVLRENGRRLWPMTLAWIVGWSIGIIPFLRTYVPVLAEGRTRSLADAMASIARKADVVNTGAGNVLWGKVLGAIPGYPVERLLQPDVYRTVTPLVLLTVLLGTICVLLDRQRRTYSTELRALPVLGATVFVLLLLPMRVFGFTVWPWIWQWIPGANAIRFAWRLQIVNAAVAAVAVTILLAWLYRRESGRPRLNAVLALVIGGVLVFEQVSRDDWAEIDRHQEIALLASIPKPPPQCHAFVMVDDVGLVRVPNSFALLAGQHVRLPAVNGLESTLYPDPRVEVIPRKTLLRSAGRWLERFGWPRGVCVLDLPRRTWDVDALSGPEALAPIIEMGMRQRLVSGADTDLLASGWSKPEDWGTWSEGPRAVLRFRVPADVQEPLTVCLEAGAFVYGTHRRQETIVSVRQREVARWGFDSHERRPESIVLSGDLFLPERLVELTFTNLTPASPKSAGLNDDPRILGLSLGWLSIADRGAPCGR